MAIVNHRAARGCTAVACAALLACSPRTERAGGADFAFGAGVGVVQSTRDTSTCLTIASADLAPGETLLVVSAKRPQGFGVARIEGRSANPCAQPGDERGSVSIEHSSSYRVTVRVVRGTLVDPLIAVRSNARLSLVADVVTGDLDGDGRPERFAQCTSREGLHLRVTTAAAGGEVERWHQYYYVPYDLEPDCPGS